MNNIIPGKTTVYELYKMMEKELTKTNDKRHAKKIQEFMCNLWKDMNLEEQQEARERAIEYNKQNIWS
jgi:hypothetical protein